MIQPLNVRKHCAERHGSQDPRWIGLSVVAVSVCAMPRVPGDILELAHHGLTGHDASPDDPVHGRAQDLQSLLESATPQQKKAFIWLVMKELRQVHSFFRACSPAPGHRRAVQLAMAARGLRAGLPGGRLVLRSLMWV